MLRLIPLQQSGKCLIRFTLSTNNNALARLGTAAVTGHHDEHHHPHEFDKKQYFARIGSREIVGYGRNGEPTYYDAADSPLPAIRWKEDSVEIKALREKAKGDWSKLSIDEKKALYRADFRQSMVEFCQQNNGEWKFTVGLVLAFIGASIWLYFGLTKLIYNYPRMENSSLEHQNRMLERMIAEGLGKVHGIANDWDYEKGDWKKNTGAK